MIVFWIDSELDYQTGHGLTLCRIYKGTALYANGRMTIFPHGKKKQLNRFLAFSEQSQPPKLISSWLDSTHGMQMIVSRGEFAGHLPLHYIDKQGNIRRTDANLTLVLSGPDWSDAKEREFQDELNLPF